MIGIIKACIVAFIKANNFLVVWCREKKKTEDSENVIFKAFAKNFLLTSWPSFYQVDFMKRSSWMCYIICYITKSRLDVQFVKKIPLEMVIGQQMKEEE